VIENSTPEFFDFLLDCPAVRPFFFDQEGLTIGAIHGMLYGSNKDLVVHMLEKSKDRKIFLNSGTFLLKPRSPGPAAQSEFYAKCAELLHKNNPESVLIEEFLLGRVKEMLSGSFVYREMDEEKELMRRISCLLPKTPLVKLFMDKLSPENLTDFLRVLPKDVQGDILKNITSLDFQHSFDVTNHPLVSEHVLQKRLEKTAKTKPPSLRKIM